MTQTEVARSDLYRWNESFVSFLHRHGCLQCRGGLCQGHGEAAVIHATVNVRDSRQVFVLLPPQRVDHRLVVGTWLGPVLQRKQCQ